MNQRKQKLNHFNGSKKQGRPSKKPQRVHVTVEQGQALFRLLCPTTLAGGLIGHSGAIIKNLELETSAKIRVEDALAADSAERLVYIVGSEAVEKSIRFRSVMNGETGDAFIVSVAQEALIRAYERIVDVETSAAQSEADYKAGGDSVVRCCRLLAVTGQIGALMGSKGKRIDKIRRVSGAFIRVLPPEQLPPCADLADELIQITGDSMAVRKALVAVSKFLQESLPKERAPVIVTTPYASSSYSPFQQAHPSIWSYWTPYMGNMLQSPSESYSSFEDRGSNRNVDRLTTVEVTFRMLCSSDVAGSVIGKGGSLVKALQDETRASISLTASVPGCHERAITISAFENVESHQSPAQNAVLHVFARITEALSKGGSMIQQNNGDSVTARLLIPSSEAGCLIGVRGTVVSELQRVTGTWIKLLEGNEVPNCASNDERVVQIAGKYVNVQNALIEITRRLREKIYSSKGLNVVQSRNPVSYPVSDFVPYRRDEGSSHSSHNQVSNHASYKNEAHSVERKMEDLNLSEGASDNHTPGFLPHHQNFADQRGKGSAQLGRWSCRKLAYLKVSCQHLLSRGSHRPQPPCLSRQGKDRSATVTNITVEVLVSENVFKSVFDEDGGSLARLREISGAKVEIQNPSRGNKGKVIISGTPDQTLAGQSLLQAYIVTAK